MRCASVRVALQETSSSSVARTFVRGRTRVPLTSADVGATYLSYLMRLARSRSQPSAPPGLACGLQAGPCSEDPLMASACSSVRSFVLATAAIALVGGAAGGCAQSVNRADAAQRQ